MSTAFRQWKREGKVAAAVQKLDKVAKNYVSGQASKKEYDKALSDLEKACEKAGTTNLDFRSFEEMSKKREANFKRYTANAALTHMDKTTWKAIKKEAGIKKSSFLKKSDASVGKHIDKYRKAYSQWSGSRIKTTAGDRKMLERAITEGQALLAALKKFVGEKEFKSELAQDLQTKCNEFINGLTSDLTEMRKLLSEAQDTTMFDRALKECFPGA